MCSQVFSDKELYPYERKKSTMKLQSPILSSISSTKQPFLQQNTTIKRQENTVKTELTLSSLLNSTKSPVLLETVQYKVCQF